MWGDFMLFYFFPNNWNIGMLRSMHSWLVHMSIWQYWLWFSFLILMVLYFTYTSKVFSFNRIDIRLRRSTGERRRNSWSEILTVILPLFWSINLISNALAYLRVLEGSGAYPFLSVQISAFQWGWRYCYGESFYVKHFDNPVSVGYSVHYVKNKVGWFPTVKAGQKLTIYQNYKVHRIPNSEYAIKPWTFRILSIQKLRKPRMITWQINHFVHDKMMWTEVYLCRFWLRQIGILPRNIDQDVKSTIFYPGYSVVGNGLKDSEILLKKDILKNITSVFNFFRLFKSSEALVLPTHVPLRLMGTSEDVTHSWAVPGLGIKLDCVPGRLFFLYTNLGRTGVFFGQCSELCGWNHYNMPVNMCSLPMEHFIIWWEIEFQYRFIEYSPEKQYYFNYNLLMDKYK